MKKKTSSLDATQQKTRATIKNARDQFSHLKNTSSVTEVSASFTLLNEAEPTETHSHISLSFSFFFPVRIKEENYSNIKSFLAIITSIPLFPSPAPLWSPHLYPSHPPLLPLWTLPSLTWSPLTLHPSSVPLDPSPPLSYSPLTPLHPSPAQFPLAAPPSLMCLPKPL